MSYGLIEITSDLEFQALIKDPSGTTHLSYSIPLSHMQFNERNLRHGNMCRALNDKHMLLKFLHHSSEMLIDQKDWLTFFILALMTQTLIALVISL